MKLGLGGVLFVVFLVLKLQHTIDWSWWWVTAPLWMPASIALAVMVGALLMAGVAALLDGKPRRGGGR